MCCPKQPRIAQHHRVADGRAALLVFALLGAALLLGSASCGTNMQAVYEGDVRFEHCMALDWRESVYRRRCWIEWVAFYTYGQTRDRVLHAQRRIQQLGLSEAAGQPAPPEGQVAADHGKRCAGQCAAVQSDCWRQCGDQPACRKRCSTSYGSCLQRCS